MNITTTFQRGILLTLLLVGANYHQAVAQTPDPGLPGTHTVLKAQYNLGDLAYTPPISVFASPLEMRGSVHYPADLTSGPFPVILYLHGRHSTCYDSVSLVSSSSWPCTGTRKPIVSYEGYDYSARTLASHGYIVISVSANAINAADASSADDGMSARGYLVQHHLDLWNTWTTTGGFPGDSLLFQGKLNMQNIGTMGHSRGGEGVIFNAELNNSLGSPYGIKAVLTLAPVDFYRHYINNIPLLNIAPYCDGDVNDLQGVHYYDNCRYADSTDETPKHNILMMGANHNFYNSVWTPGSYVAGGGDDWLYTGSNTSTWCGAGATVSGRFDTTKQMAAYNAYSAAFYRIYLGHETAFAPILEVSDITPPASSMLDSSNVFVSYHPGRTLRLDVNRTDTVTNLSVNTMGGAVSDSGLLTFNICGGGITETACSLSTAAAKEPHKGTATKRGLSQMRLRWNDTTEWMRNEIPAAYEDLTYYESVIFRATVNYQDYASGPPLNFTIQLIDSAGNTSGVAVGDYTHSLFRQPGTATGDLPKDVFNSIRIPLSDFSGIDMSKVKTIKFLFNKSAAGGILISDLSLISTPCGRLSTSFHDTIISGHQVAFTDSNNANYGDTVSMLWNFGDPASGVNDTSSLHNPMHIYSGSGTFTACLYVQSLRRNGTVCTDTFCSTVTIAPPTGIEAINSSKISIYPNPAKDYLQITGASEKDVLNLYDVYGRVVFTTNISSSMVYLPHPLAVGVYYAIVTTADGDKVFKKLFINQ